MEKVFDAHIHHTFSMPLKTAIEIFRREFSETKTERQAFLALPNEVSPEKGFYLDEMQNLKMLYLKLAFSPTAYAYAGLEHPLNVSEKDRAYLSREYLRQAEEYASVGFDGMKMLEGYPSLRKVMKRELCDGVYDRYYSFLQENSIPITMHVANPEENWDITKADPYAIKMGRVYDNTYPSRIQLLDEVVAIMQKFPKLKLSLAHFGFMSYDIDRARRWLDYENTALDITPGGEQFINMLNNWASWEKLFIEYQDKIIYGTDYYAFHQDENWVENFTRRPNFIRQFFETETEHTYLGSKFKGVKLNGEILNKIYWENPLKLLGKPKLIDYSYLTKKAQSLLNVTKKHCKFADEDLIYILNNVKSKI